jgi:putative flavoprotein involved in K+ transport
MTLGSADVDVLVVGAGHGGLGVAARLLARGRSPLLVDESSRVGEIWRRRWPSLRLFTPRFVDTLPGMPFPEGRDPFPGKDEVAAYQQSYAEHLKAPMRLGQRVRRVTPSGDGFVVAVGEEFISARNVVVATGAHYTPRIPAFAARLDPAVRQLHSSEYGTAGPLPEGPVLVVGGRNSGAEIAMDLAASHEVTITRATGTWYAPARWRSPRWWRSAQFRSWLLRGAILPGPLPWPLKPPGGAWIEVDIDRAAREGTLRLAPRAVEAEGAVIRFADGSDVRPRTVVWATGFRIDDSWIDVPSGERGMPLGRHRRGPVPGLWANRGRLLATLHWGALDVVSDLVATRPVRR